MKVNQFMNNLTNLFANWQIMKYYNNKKPVPNRSRSLRIDGITFLHLSVRFDQVEDERK